jgi:IclR family KDG regulon transcriptional repressor
VCSSDLKKNFLSKNPTTKRYRLGAETVRIGFSYLNNLNLVQVTRPYLQNLSQKINETACLLIREGAYGVYLDKIDTNHAVRVHADIGAKVPLYAGSASKALIAFLPDTEQEKILAAFASSPPIMPFSEEALKKEFATIREQGYAISKEEIDPGVIAIGSPIFGVENKVVGAISVPLPKERASAQHLGQIVSELRETCGKVSRQLGCEL